MSEPAADSSCVTERGPDFGSSEACPEIRRAPVGKDFCVCVASRERLCAFCIGAFC